MVAAEHSLLLSLAQTPRLSLGFCWHSRDKNSGMNCWAKDFCTIVKKVHGALRVFEN